MCIRDSLRGEGDTVARIVLPQFLAADPRAVRQLKVVEMDRIVVAVEDVYKRQVEASAVDTACRGVISPSPASPFLKILPMVFFHQ